MNEILEELRKQEEMRLRCENERAEQREAEDVGGPFATLGADHGTQDGDQDAEAVPSESEEEIIPEAPDAFLDLCIDERPFKRVRLRGKTTVEERGQQHSPVLPQPEQQDPEQHQRREIYPKSFRVRRLQAFHQAHGKTEGCTTCNKSAAGYKHTVKCQKSHL